MTKDLLFFYGLECPHCIRMEKFVDKLKKEGHDIEKVEIWHNEKNNKMMEELDNEPEPCGGVPFFLNKKSKKTVCGEVTYKELKEWAEEE
jgi:glutaredoxin-related protein